jgi:hypothetical protein
MREMRSNTPKQLAAAERLLRNLYANISEEIDFRTAFQMFSRRDYGTVYLNAGEAEEYRTVVDGLMKAYASDNRLSRRAIETELREAVFTSFGKSEAKRSGFERRVKRALQELHVQLKRSTTPYKVFIPVAGASPEGLPFTFGKVRFVQFNHSQFRKFRSETSKHQGSREEMEQRRAAVNQLKLSDLWHRVCAVVEIQARDRLAADDLARRETQDALDTLNFFADLMPYHRGRLYLNGARELRAVAAPLLEEGGGWSIPMLKGRPPAPFAFDKLRQSVHLRPILRRVHGMSRSEGIRPVAEVLLTAVRWAGRAVTEPRREHAFLLYAIALESAVLPAGTSESIGYRLRMRVSNLLENRADRRNDMVRRVRDLYSTRSKIVHSGWYHLSAEESEQMRQVCKEVLLRLLTHRSLTRMTSAADLEAWFERQTFR